ncbi:MULTISPECIES: 16S rRNA (guanine(527)-N(7))-methyltransferase RsmG [Hwangdonia]|uniref:Ribosomal RNA small subunit methyltransferase G n=1 Tax=Hwangdonia seohaensis TaxID=1240727 RepID=A0ABW3RCI4_9FLAO|nr:16S rRNA (guanine(527)-N(7))-methyltransferase RsmG [Hwangdonia seohaensis]
MDLILKYFPNLSDDQIEKFSRLESLYKDWNLKINVVSRKDIDELYLRHVLHALAIAKLIQFKDGSKLLDVGTGGGFPGIPLAILFPECSFHLVDSIAKKLKVVDEVVAGLELTNVKTTHSRVEAINDTYDFIISRAVAAMPTFVHWVKGKIAKQQNNDLKNGILYLKGGDLTEELKTYKTATVYNLSDYYTEDFFETKKLVHLPLKFRG